MSDIKNKAQIIAVLCFLLTLYFVFTKQQNFLFISGVFTVLGAIIGWGIK